jgi:hypothetical protein
MDNIATGVISITLAVVVAQFLVEIEVLLKIP